MDWPWFLPDGKRFLYTARLDDGEGELRLGQLDGATQTVMRVSSNAQWVDPDIVVFAREGVLMGQRVDVETIAAHRRAVHDCRAGRVTSSRRPGRCSAHPEQAPSPITPAET